MIEQLSNGIVLGAVLASTSLGLSLLFSVTNSFSFAHGDLVTVGAIVAVILSGAGIGLPVWLAIVLACASGVLLGLLLDRLMFRPMRRKGVGGITLLVTTLGLALIVRYLILALVGPAPRGLPLGAQQVQTYLGLRLTPSSALAVLLSVAVLVLVGLFLLWTPLGISMRAVANNPQLAMASGISVDRTVALAWALACGLAAFGGTVMALTQLVYWDMGFHLLLLIFASVILGGLGTAFGAMLGGFLIGIVTQLSVTLPVIRDHVDLKIAVGLGVMALVLLLRPQGLMGRAVRAS